MTTLVFEPTLSGHHLEYLHHIYMGAMQKPGCRYVFAVPRGEWEQKCGKQEWPEEPNIEWVMLDDDECRTLLSGNQLAQCWRTAKMIRRTARRCGADRIILITLASAIPLLPLMLPSRVRVSGIIYKIYLRSRKGRVSRMIDKLRYCTMARSHSMGSVFILNDPTSAGQLNKIYRTDRFRLLPDPVPEVNPSDLQNLRSELGVDSKAKVFLHFGALTERKGTLVILRSLLLMSSEELADKVYIFAGRVSDGMRDAFYNLVEKAGERGGKIIVKDEFVDYSTLNSLCHTADVILAPYLLTDLSSGVIGYGAAFHRPVVGPAAGLIGELISTNGLGVVLPQITPEALRDVYSQPLHIADNGSYARFNSIQNFQITILN